MKRGDRLMTQSIADFGSTSEEAADLYFRAVEKGIELSFYDSSYMDSQTLAVDSNPTADESRLIRRIINNYYRQKDIAPLLSKDDLTTLAGMPAAKKNLMLDQIRAEIIDMITRYRFESSIMNAFVREHAISARSYKRRYHKNR